MAKALKVVGKIASVAAVALAFVPGGQPFAAAASAISAVANAGAQLLAQPEPQGGAVSKVLIDTSAPTPYVIGRTMTGGVLVHDAGYGSRYKKIDNPNRSMVFVYSDCGPVQEIEALYTDGAFAVSSGAVSGYYSGNMHFSKQLGSRPQFSALSGNQGTIPRWGSQYRLSAKAAGLVTMRWDKDLKKFSAGAPDLTVVMKGVKVYDPRLDSTYPGGSGSCRVDNEATFVYSENPSCHALTYIYGRYEGSRRIFGVGKSIDSIDVGAFVEWANLCDINNWKVGGVIYEPADKWNNLKLIMQAGSARPVHSNGVLSVVFDSPRVPAETFTEDDLANGDVVIPSTQSFRDRLNGIVPRYRSSAHNWEYVPGTTVSVPEYVAADGEDKRREIQYTLVQSQTQAAQLAGYEVVNSRELKGISLPLKPKILAYGSGEAISLNMPNLGLIGTFIIESRSFDPLSAITTTILRTETASKHPFALGATTTPPDAPALVLGEDLDNAQFSAAGGVAAIETMIATSWTKSLVITATGGGEISLSNHSRIYPDETISVLGDTITGLNLDTRYSVYYDDADRNGGAVTYVATTAHDEAQTSEETPSRHFIGYVTTPAATASPPNTGTPSVPPNVVPESVPSAGALNGVNADAIFADIATNFTAINTARTDFQAADLTLQANINSAVNQFQLADAAISSQLSAVNTDLQNSKTTLSGSISALDLASTNARALLSTQLTQLETSLLGAGGRVVNLETADAERASQVSVLQFRADAVLAARDPGTIQEGKYGAVANTPGPFGERDLLSHPAVLTLPVFQGGEDGANSLSITGEHWVYYSEFIPVDPEEEYELSLHARQTSPTAGNSVIFLGVVTYDEDFNFISGGEGIHRYGSPIHSGEDHVGIWNTYSSRVGGGQGDAQPLFRPGTRYVRKMFIVNYNDGTGTVDVDSYRFESVSDIEAREAFSRVTAVEAVANGNATRLTAVETLSSSNSSRITTQETTTISHASRLGTLETSSGDANSRIGSLETTSANHGSRLSTVETTSGSNTARVGTLETTSSNQSQRISNVEFVAAAEASSTDNGRMRNAEDVYTYFNAAGDFARKDFSTSSLALTPVVLQQGESGGSVVSMAGWSSIYSTDFIPVDTEEEYELEVKLKQSVAGGPRQVFAGVVTYDENFNLITGGSGTHRYTTVNLTAPNDWETHKGKIQGEGDGNYQFRPGTKYVRKLLLANHLGGTGTLLVEKLRFQKVAEIEARDAYTRVLAVETVNADQASRLTAVEGSSANALSRVGTLETTSANHGSRLNTVETTSGSNSSRVGSLETTSASHGSRLSSVETTTGTNTARVGTLETSSSDQAQRISNVELVAAAGLSDLSLGLLTSPADRFSFFTRWSSGDAVARDIRSRPDHLAPVVTNQGENGAPVFVMQGYSTVYFSDFIPVDPDDEYQTQVRMRQAIDAGSNKSVYVGIATFDKDFNYIPGGAGSYRYPILNAQPTAAWQTYTGTTQGIGDAHANFKAGTKYIRLMLNSNYINGTGTLHVQSLSFDKVKNIQARDAYTRVLAVETVNADQASRLTAVEGSSANALSRVGTLETTSANHGSRLNTVETTSGSNSSRVGSLETTSANHGSRLSTVETTSGSNTSRIGTLELTDAQTATKLSVVEAGSRAGNEKQKSGTMLDADRTFTAFLNRSGNFFMFDIAQAPGAVSLSVDNLGEDGAPVMIVPGYHWVYDEEFIPVDPTQRYVFSAKFKQITGVGEGNTRVFPFIVTYDEDFNFISGGAGTHRYPTVPLSFFANGDWKTLSGVISGEGDAHANFRPGTRYVRRGIICNYNGGTGTTHVESLRFTTELEARSLLAQEAAFNAAARTASANIVAAASTSDANTARISILARKDDGTEYTAIGLEADILRHSIDGDLIWQSTAGGVELLKPQRNVGPVLANGSRYMEVRGPGNFGSTYIANGGGNALGDLIWWYGPYAASNDACSLTNCIRAMGIDGQWYEGGASAPGSPITNSGSNNSTAGPIIGAETGNTISAGNAIEVTYGYSFSKFQFNPPTGLGHPSTWTPTASIKLYKKLNGASSWTLVATKNLSGSGYYNPSFNGGNEFEPEPFGEGELLESLSGTFNHTEPAISSGQSYEFKVELSARNVRTAAQSASLSVSSFESGS